MRIVLARHGETPWNREGRFQGQNDIGLSDAGLAQARETAAALEDIEVAAICSSPLARALQTAEIIAHGRSMPVILVDELKEMSEGVIEGLNNSLLRQLHPDIFHQWRDDPSKARIPGGETLGELQARAWRGVERIREDHPHGTTVAVSHNFAIITIVCRLLELPLDRFHRLRVDLGSLTTLEHGERGWRLASLNETRRLPPA